mgnify:CR=1 FL=1
MKNYTDTEGNKSIGKNDDKHLNQEYNIVL